MSGMREAFDEIVADVPVYGDLDERPADVCPGSRGRDPLNPGFPEPPLRIGVEVYKLFRQDAGSHGLELRVSRDHCRTWHREFR